jgi:hypothetical protein
MKTAFIALVGLTFAATAYSQIEIQKPCNTKSQLLPDGRVQLIDCQGKTSVVDPSTSGAAKTEAQTATAGTTSVPMNSHLAQAYEEFELANLRYEMEQLSRNTRVFAWQDLSTKMMFFLVFLIVMTGLVLACVQFRKAADIDLSIATAGLHLKTTLVGVVILAMSIVFLCLYLVLVYPIKGIGQ